MSLYYHYEISVRLSIFFGEREKKRGRFDFYAAMVIAVWATITVFAEGVLSKHPVNCL